MFECLYRNGPSVVDCLNSMTVNIQKYITHTHCCRFT